MKRPFVFAAMLACGRSPEPLTPARSEGQGRTDASAATHSEVARPKARAATSVTPAGPEGAPAPPDPIPDENLPSPRATTLPLRAGDAADADMDDADTHFERAAYAEVARVIALAKRKEPSSPSVVVAQARLDVAKLNLAAGFGAGKDNAVIAHALTQLRAVVAKHTDYAAAQGELGKLCLLAGDAKGAHHALRAAASVMSTHPDVHGNLGLAQLVLGEREAALASLRRAVELDPGSAPRRGNFATALLLEGRVDEAVRHYGVQVKIAPDDAHARSDLGTALLGTGDLARAVRELERAVELAPDRATFRSNLGYALARAKRGPEAIAQYRRAVALDAKLVSAWVNLAIELAREAKTKAQRDEAKKCVERALKLDPTDTRTKEVIDEINALPPLP